MATPSSQPTAKNSHVQIVVPTAEILHRINSFQLSKREEVNRENIIEFCHTAYQNGGQTCARVDAVVTKRSDCKSHVKVYRVVNEWGPQLGVPDPSYKAERARDHNGEAVAVLPPPIDERLHNAEVHLKLEANCPVPTDIYTRLRCIEQRILSLEGVSPEYADKVADRVRLVFGKDVPHIPVNKRGYSKYELRRRLSLLKSNLVGRTNKQAYSRQQNLVRATRVAKEDTAKEKSTDQKNSFIKKKSLDKKKSLIDKKSSNKKSLAQKKSLDKEKPLNKTKPIDKKKSLGKLNKK